MRQPKIYLATDTYYSTRRHNRDTGWTEWDRSPQAPYVKYKEVILSNDNPKLRRKVKGCYHTKYEVVGVGENTDASRRSNSGSVAKFTQLPLTPDNIPSVVLPASFSPDIDSLIRTAVGKLLPSFNALTFFGEGLDFNKGKLDIVNPLPDFTQGVSGAVLSTNLGFLPFVDDLQSIGTRVFQWSKTIDRFADVLKRGLRSTTQRTSSLSGITHVFSGSYIFETHYEVKVKEVYGVRVTGTVPNYLRSPVLRFLDRTASLGAAWELVPFSFLVDYFVPIGDALQRGHNIDNVRISQAWYSRKREYTFRVYGNGQDLGLPEANTNDPYEIIPVGPSLIQVVRYTVYERTPTLWDSIDGISVGKIKNPLKSLRKMSNIIALAAQARKSK